MNFTQSILFTRAELSLRHRQFFHPGLKKLFNVIKIAHPEEATPELLKTLQDFRIRCDPCQRTQYALKRFLVTIGAEHLRFNEIILLDIIYINGNPVLYS